MLKINYLLDNSEGIIFDCDGTLVDSMPLHMKAWKFAFEKHNKKYNKEFLFSLAGMKEIEIVKLYNNSFKTSLDPQKMVNDKHNFFNNHIAEVKPVQAVKEIALKYYSRIPMSVVSGSVEQIVHAELRIIGVYDLFKTIITADDPFKPKPDPHGFIEAARRMKVNPKNIVVFEDGASGITAAINASMQVIDIREMNLT